MNINYKKSALAALALSFAIPAVISAPTLAQAKNSDVIIGSIIGGVVASKIERHHAKKSYSKQRRHHRQPVYEGDRYGRSHVNWCYDNYGSYSVRDNTFVTRSGHVQYCYSPYN